MSDSIVLAYSGGLDTSAAVKWLREEREQAMLPPEELGAALRTC